MNIMMENMQKEEASANTRMAAYAMRLQEKEENEIEERELPV